MSKKSRIVAKHNRKQRRALRRRLKYTRALMLAAEPGDYLTLAVYEDSLMDQLLRMELKLEGLSL